MRIAVLAVTAATVFLGGCGGSETNQANNAQVNIANSVSPPATTDANAITDNMVMLAVAPEKDQALKIMHDREVAMKGLGKAMKTLHRALDAGDIDAVRAQTAIMAAAAPKIPAMFPPGTGPDVGKTRAKPEIWKRQSMFLRKSRDFAVAAQAIDAAAKAADLNKVMALHDGVDKACDACHKPFRAPEH
jgi:cytochrome c556